MQTIKRPYEFLVRWNRDGGLSGAHAQFRYITLADDGTTLGEFLGVAEPAAVAGNAGFPLDDILNEVLTAALAEAERLRGELGGARQQGADAG